MTTTLAAAARTSNGVEAISHSIHVALFSLFFTAETLVAPGIYNTYVRSLSLQP